MKNYFVTLDLTISISDLHYMEDFVMEYTHPSVIEQALEGVEESALDQAYRNFIIEEFLRESILRERQRSEKEEEEGLTPSSFSVWRADAPPVPLN